MDYLKATAFVFGSFAVGVPFLWGLIVLPLRLFGEYGVLVPLSFLIVGTIFMVAAEM